MNELNNLEINITKMLEQDDVCKQYLGNMNLFDCQKLVHTVLKIMECVDKIKQEELRKKISEEIERKLEIITELGKLYDELKKVPFYKLSKRQEITLKILKLESKQKYGW